MAAASGTGSLSQTSNPKELKLWSLGLKLAFTWAWEAGLLAGFFELDSSPRGPPGGPLAGAFGARLFELVNRLEEPHCKASGGRGDGNPFAMFENME